MKKLARLFGKEREKRLRCCAVVVAAGSSSRMNGVNKILAPLGDRPLLAHTLSRLEACPLVDEIIVVTRQDLLEQVGGLCAAPQLQKVIKVVAGGSRRIESVLSGVREAPREAELIAVHDGARPFASPRLLEEVIRKAAQCGAAAPAIPVKDTVKRAGGAVVEETLNRSDLFCVQTPQVFDAALLRGALEQALAAGEAPTDDCATVERLGMKVALTVGSDYNFKITTPLDLVLAGAVLEEGGFLADRTGV